MGFFSSLFRSRDAPQNRTAGSGYTFYFGGSTSGKAVTERSAMQMTAVYSCVRILSEAVAGLPLHLYKCTDNGGKEKAVDHPLYLLLHDEPNPEMTSFVFRETLMTHLLLWGNAYAQVIRNGKGEVVALYPLMPNKMTVDRDERGQLYYRYQRGTDEAIRDKNQTVILRPPDVLHIPGLGFDGLVGYSPIAMAKNATGTAKRDEFNRMLVDCEAGKIDIILVKSISRFARNTVDLLETIRHLKDIGVEVRFEREHISSFSGDGELMLTILASFAQEESRSISDNVKWGIRKRMAEGIPNRHFRILGYRWEGDDLVIVPEEAAIVRRIFQNFLDGKSRLETERELEAEGIRSINGCVMRDSNIKQILTNITYTGNMLLQKEFIEDPTRSPATHGVHTLGTMGLIFHLLIATVSRSMR